MCVISLKALHLLRLARIGASFQPMVRLPLHLASNRLATFLKGWHGPKPIPDLTGFIDKKGNWVIEAKYEATKDFSNGLARVKSGAWTFVDKTGKTIATPSADSFGDFSDGLAYYKSAEKVGFIDKTGKLVIPQEFPKVRDFKNGYAAALKGDKWGFIDKTGKWAIEPKFDAVKDFEATAP